MRPWTVTTIRDLIDFGDRMCYDCQWRWHDCGIIERGPGALMPEWMMDKNDDPVCADYKWDGYD